MNFEKKVMAVVVTYNRKELLKECVNALLNQEYRNCDILIVDNASTDGTQEYLNEEIKNLNVHYVNTGANLGGAGGFNYGMKEAYKIGCDFMWIMDDDCIVHNDTLTELIRADENLKGEYGFLSSKVLWKDNSICKMNIQKRKFSKWLKDFDKNMQPIAMASFVSLFIKTSVVRELGLPIKDFFIWTDDWEYTRRISRKYKCYFISKSIVTHKSALNEGASIATVDGDRLERFKYMYRNDVVLYRREGIKGWFLLYIRLIIHKMRVLKSKKEDKKERMNIINNSIKNGKNFFPKIEYPINRNLIRVLQVFGEPLSNGGQEVFTMNMYEKIDKKNVQFDFYTPFYCDNIHMKQRIEELGGKVFVDNGSFRRIVRKTNFKRNFKKFGIKHKYDIVHINSGSTYELAWGAYIAKKSGAKKVIVHSHSVSKDSGMKKALLKKITEKKFIQNADIYLACSELAAKTKFPKYIYENKKYIVIKNGINIENFSFKDDVRQKYRNELKLNGKKVICQVGRLEEQKNQKVTINIFEEIYKKEPNAILLLIGDGPEKEKIKKIIDEKNLKEHIRLLGIRNDVYNILQAVDLFLFPSEFEGLGIVAIEAQAAGVPIICSNGIPEEAKITNLFHYVSLKNFNEWVEMSINILNKKEKRKNMSEEIIKQGYDAETSAKKLTRIYVD